MKHFALVLAPALALLMHGMCLAAEVNAPKTPRCTFNLKGDIVSGDADRLKKVMDPVVEEFFGDRMWICLNSENGGDFQEAIKIIDYMLENGGTKGLGTVVEAGKKCNSACALIFLAGRLHHGDGYFTTQRLLHPKSRLGFHAPFSASDAGSDKKQLIAASFKNGVKAVQSLLKYDKDLFPKSLLTTMLSKEPGEYFEISTIDDLGRWDIGLYDYREPKVNSERQLYEVCLNVDSWKNGESSDRPPNEFADPADDPDKKTWKPVKSLSAAKSFNFSGFGSEYGDRCRIEISFDSDTDEVPRIFATSFEGQVPTFRALWEVIPANKKISTLAKN